uniref:Uncharacterized protein n=1 Tax=Romanomermis culicivorax TaxID=13658 RepID=A0A915KN82_ROMCU
MQILILITSESGVFDDDGRGDGKRRNFVSTNSSSLKIGENVTANSSMSTANVFKSSKSMLITDAIFSISDFDINLDKINSVPKTTQECSHSNCVHSYHYSTRCHLTNFSSTRSSTVGQITVITGAGCAGPLLLSVGRIIVARVGVPVRLVIIGRYHGVLVVVIDRRSQDYNLNKAANINIDAIRIQQMPTQATMYDQPYDISVFDRRI